MSDFSEVQSPILNSPYVEPSRYWRIVYGEPAEQLEGRREAGFWRKFKDENEQQQALDGFETGPGKWVPFDLVNDLRPRVKAWRDAGWKGATRVTLDLLRYWRREDREGQTRLFFAQLEAAETAIFLKEGPYDLKQGINVPRDLAPQTDNYHGFERLALKMATGSGKTTVMGLLAAWSILNKRAYPNDSKYSDTILVVCPNLTIKERLSELDPQRQGGGLYRSRDLVPPDLMPELRQGKVAVTNWHIFEPRVYSDRVDKRGVRVEVTETIYIAKKDETRRGRRYLTEATLTKQLGAGLMEVVEEKRSAQGELQSVKIRSVKNIESPTSVVRRVLRELKLDRKQNIFVFNDEAHHAYRLVPQNGDTPPKANAEDEEELEQREKRDREATVWIDGLDKLNRSPGKGKGAGINFCVDFSATPFYLGSAGVKANEPFEWIVSDFSLVESIESGLVKVPQLPVRDPAAGEEAQYFRLWQWVKSKLDTGEKGGRHGEPKPAAVLKYAMTALGLLYENWEMAYHDWEDNREDKRRPVLIIVCKNTRIADVFYRWLALDEVPKDLPKSKLELFKNKDGALNTIRVDSRVIEDQEEGSDATADEEQRWMRITLDTVGRQRWPVDEQGNPVYPADFEKLAQKRNAPIHPPGRDVRCVVSVSMLTEGWDCNTVTHILGLRPFTTQLLCEQVAGRALRRVDYELDPETGQFTEEVAQIFGVPFEVIPFKAHATKPPRPQTMHHVYAMPERARMEINFPRVEGYAYKIKRRVMVNWDSIAPLPIDQHIAASEVETKAYFPGNQDRHTIYGPGALDTLKIDQLRSTIRIQNVEFELASRIVKTIFENNKHEIELTPAQLFPQVLGIVRHYVKTKVQVIGTSCLQDLFFSPYFGWAIEILSEAIVPASAAVDPEIIPIFEQGRDQGSTADVEFWTSKKVFEVQRSHLNCVAADTMNWEQSAAYIIDTHPAVEYFVKNDRLGFTIPYLRNHEYHEYVPDFIVKLRKAEDAYLIIETKGYDLWADLKHQHAEKWVEAVNRAGQHGHWAYFMAKELALVKDRLDQEL